MADVTASSSSGRSALLPGAQGFWPRLLSRPAARFGLGLLTLLILAALLAPVLAPDAPNAQNWLDRLKPPSAQHPFGTDAFGRSVLTRVLYGARISLLAGILPVALGLTVGTTIGILAGYFGKNTDRLFMRLMDVLLAFPGLLLALAIIGTLGPGFKNAVIAIGVGMIPVFARLSRAEVMNVKTNDFVEAAGALGAGHARIIFRHLLPSMTSPLVVQSTISIGSAILSTAGLSFLGLGVQPPTSDWGEMLSSARRYLPGAWWLTVFPGIMIALTVLSFNLIGDGLRDALDPRARLRRTKQK